MTQKPEDSSRKAKRPWVGEWLAAYLLKTGENQDILAIRWGYTTSMINKILKGRADLASSHWPDLATLLGISVERIVQGPSEVEQCSTTEDSPANTFRWMAEKAILGVLTERGLKKATAEQRDLLASHLARLAASGAGPDQLQKELNSFLDLLQAAIGRRESK